MLYVGSCFHVWFSKQLVDWLSVGSCFHVWFSKQVVDWLSVGSCFSWRGMDCCIVEWVECMYQVVPVSSKQLNTLATTDLLSLG